MADLEEKIIRAVLLGVFFFSLVASFLAVAAWLWVELIRYVAGGCG